MAWLARYTTEFKSTFRNETHKGIIYRENESGNVDKDPPQDQPLVVMNAAQDETLECPIRGSEMIMKMYSDSDYEFMELFLSNARKYRVQHQYSGGMIWHGWLTPERYSEPHQPHEYAVAVHAHDGIGFLKEKEWKNGDILYTGKQQCLQTILNILQKTGLEVDVWESCYIYESHHDSNTHTDSPLAQTYFDAENFLKDEDTAWNCYDVLQELLGRFNLFVRYYGGYFHIVQINAQKGPYIRRKYSYDGTYLTYELYDPVISITATSEPIATFLGWIDDWATDSIEKAWKKLILKQSYGLKENLIINTFYYGIGYTTNYGDEYEKVDTVSKIVTIQNIYIEGVTSGDLPNGVYCQAGWIEASTTQRLNVILSGNTDAFTSVGGDPKCEFAIAVYIEASPGGTRRYLEADSKWYSTRKKLWSFTESVGNTRGQLQLEIISDVIPIPGTIYVEIYSEMRANGVADWEILNFWFDYGNSSIVIVDSEEGVPEELELETEIDENNNFEETFETVIGDLPLIDNAQQIYNGGLYYINGKGEYTPTAAWGIHGEGFLGANKSLNDIVSDEMCINHTIPILKREGKLLGVVNPVNIISEGGVKFSILRCDSDYGEDTHDVLLLQLSGTLTDGAYLKLKSEGYIRMKSGGRIKLKGRNK